MVNQTNNNSNNNAQNENHTERSWVEFSKEVTATISEKASGILGGSTKEKEEKEKEEEENNKSLVDKAVDKVKEITEKGAEQKSNFFGENQDSTKEEKQQRSWSDFTQQIVNTTSEALKKGRSSDEQDGQTKSEDSTKSDSSSSDTNTRTWGEFVKQITLPVSDQAAKVVGAKTSEDIEKEKEKEQEDNKTIVEKAATAVTEGVKSVVLTGIIDEEEEKRLQEEERKKEEEYQRAQKEKEDEKPPTRSWGEFTRDVSQPVVDPVASVVGIQTIADVKKEEEEKKKEEDKTVLDKIDDVADAAVEKIKSVILPEDSDKDKETK